MINIEYFEQLINSVEKAISNFDNLNINEKEKIKQFISTILKEKSKILNKELSNDR